jgi:hypothetical protein
MPTTWSIALVGDYNGDGLSDLGKFEHHWRARSCSKDIPWIAPCGGGWSPTSFRSRCSFVARRGSRRKPANGSRSLIKHSTALSCLTVQVSMKASNAARILLGPGHPDLLERAPGFRVLARRQLFKTLAVLWIQQCWLRVFGHTSSTAAELIKVAVNVVNPEVADRTTIVWCWRCPNPHLIQDRGQATRSASSAAFRARSARSRPLPRTRIASHLAFQKMARLVLRQSCLVALANLGSRPNLRSSLSHSVRDPLGHRFAPRTERATLFNTLADL